MLESIFGGRWLNYPVERKLSSVNKTLLLLTVEHFHWRCASGVKSDIGHNEAAISWRASGNRQISLNASAERAFANFRDKKHRILQLQIFATKTSFLHIFALTALRLR